MFGVLEDAIRKAKTLDAFEGLSFVLLLPKNADLIPELIQEQLWSGLSGSGETLKSIGGGYSPYTISSKKRKGLPTDRVTLFQTGVYYQSIIVTIQADGWTVEHDPIKDGQNLENRWGNELVDLTDESTIKLIDKITTDYIKWLAEYLTT